MNEIVTITDFIETDFTETYVSESNRIRNAMQISKVNTINNSKVESDIFIKKLFNYDFFGIAYEYIHPRDLQMARISQLVNQYSNLDLYSFYNIIMQSSENLIYNTNYNNNQFMKNIVIKSENSIDNFKLYKSPFLNPTNDYKSTNTYYAIRNDQQLYLIDYNSLSIRKISNDILKNNKKINQGASIVTADGYIYIMGGYEGTGANRKYHDEILRLDLRTLNVVQVAKMRHSRSDFKTYYDQVSKQIYIIGGISQCSIEKTKVAYRCVKPVEVYNILTKECDAKFNLMKQRFDFGLCRVRTKSYDGLIVAGGMDDDGNYLDSIEFFDMKKNKDYQLLGVVLPMKTSKIEIIGYREQVYLLGGEQAGKLQSKVYSLDIERGNSRLIADLTVRKKVMNKCMLSGDSVYILDSIEKVIKLCLTNIEPEEIRNGELVGLDEYKESYAAKNGDSLSDNVYIVSSF